MELFFFRALPFLKLFFAFFIILAGMHYRLNLGLAILLGSIALAFLFHLSVPEYVSVLGDTFVSPSFLLMGGIIACILIFSRAMEASGQSERLMDGLAAYLKRVDVRLVFFPALIGLLPMPGGAIFSAPMVATVSRNMPVTDRDRALINYWFRHVWEMCWPLYPGVILTVALADIELFDLLAKTWPGTPVMIAIGWFFFLRPIMPAMATIAIKDTKRTHNPAQTTNIPAAASADNKQILREGLPLIIAIGGAVIGEVFFSFWLPDTRFELAIILAFIVSIVCILLQNPTLGISFVGKLLRQKSLWSMLWVVTAIFIFKDTLGATDMVTDMAQSAGPSVLLLTTATLLPFLVGLVAGINIAFVGATFPLLIEVIQTLGMQDQLIAYLLLATFAGFSGVMVSPVHICFLLTCQHFHCSIAPTWRRLVVPCSLLLLSGVLLFFLLLL